MDGKSTGERIADSLKKLPDTVQGSQAWNSIFRPGSIFRNGYTDSPRNRSYVIMNSVLYHLHPVKVKRHAVKVSYTLCLGGLSFFLFILLTVTGIFLMFFYRPTAAQAWDDIYTLQTSVTFGLLVRNMHRWGAHLMVLSCSCTWRASSTTGLQAAPGVQLGDRRGAAAAHPAAVLHRLPAPVGPARPVGGHGGHEHDGLHARLRNQVRFVLLGGARSAPTRSCVVRAARPDAPVRDRHLHGDPLLAGAQGRRHLRPAVIEEGTT
jgi:hypothetical protein